MTSTKQSERQLEKALSLDSDRMLRVGSAIAWNPLPHSVQPIFSTWRLEPQVSGIPPISEHLTC